MIATMAVSDRYLERKLAGLCTRCGDPAQDGYQLCAECRAITKERTRRSMSKMRGVRMKHGLCVHCGNKRPRGSGPVCPKCQVKYARIPKYAVSARVVNQRVNQAGDLAERQLELEADGKQRYRYHGRGERGRQPLIVLDEQDLKEAGRCLEQGAAGLRYFWSDAVQALSKDQKAGVRSAALDKLAELKRWIDEVLVREGRLPRPDDDEEDSDLE